MPWGKPHVYNCIEPGCGKSFESTTTNVKRCPECRYSHNKQRILAIYRKKRGKLYGMRPDKNQPLSEMARFNLWMTKTWQNAICPECGKHMTSCQCCEPVVQHVAPEVVEMWIPERLPLPQFDSA
jgi:hypothetical protein